MESKKVNGVTLYQASGDANNNPRVIVHFWDLLNDTEMSENDSVRQYEIAREKARKCGFKAYRGRDFGGGFIRQGSIQLPSDVERISREINKYK